MLAHLEKPGLHKNRGHRKCSPGSAHGSNNDDRGSYLGKADEPGHFLQSIILPQPPQLLYWGWQCVLPCVLLKSTAVAETVPFTRTKLCFQVSVSKLHKIYAFSLEYSNFTCFPGSSSSLGLHFGLQFYHKLHFKNMQLF